MYKFSCTECILYGFPVDGEIIMVIKYYVLIAKYYIYLVHTKIGIQ